MTKFTNAVSFKDPEQFKAFIDNHFLMVDELEKQTKLNEQLKNFEVGYKRSIRILNEDIAKLKKQQADPKVVQNLQEQVIGLDNLRVEQEKTIKEQELVIAQLKSYIEQQNLTLQEYANAVAYYENYILNGMPFLRQEPQVQYNQNLSVEDILNKVLKPQQQKQTKQNIHPHTLQQLSKLLKVVDPSQLQIG